ncbi:MarR family transcriptional regulator [Mycobacterium sp. 236(2023)]|uniref:MarR family transcriptional regulator n=1 Tax=Mycobacterium sp. 236(2023) TaxID=3038163 RepID=UPI002414D804|nr:MarR family transcriptional regulator [Mycobacterium sp. 236(2023)]MDG4665825.1 MarR family transcriptional regulator [Mycobacterium sp. 236(2023)]
MSRQPHFTPTAADAEDLEAMTLGRTDLIDTLTSRIASSARDGSRPHTLLVAPRGAGKTHSLKLALHHALSDPATAARVLPVVIAEDSLAVGSYADLLVEMARTVGAEKADEARALRRARDPVGIEAAILAAAAGRMVLLAIENLDRVFDTLGEKGQGSLRAWVETSTDVLVLGTAPALFPGVSSREYPWYGSFIIETLPELTVEDAIELLRRSARRRDHPDLEEFLESASGPARVGALHAIIGGRPRLWHLLADDVDVTSLDAVSPVIDALLDRLTPHYQQIVWQLPPGEQRLVVELARGSGARSVSDLAEAVGVSNQSASTALGRLAADQWVTSAKADGDRRTSWYDLTDPLLRRYLQFRGA